MSRFLGSGTGVSLTPSHGMNAIMVTFGNTFAYIRPDHTLDPRWSTDVL
jgi:hypothetical protein